MENEPNQKKARLTFHKKEAMECPICKTQVFQEDLLTGRGRLIAGGLSLELRRMYKPSATWGKVYPLIYPVVVCPKCLFAAYASDFMKKIGAKSQFAEFVKDSKDRAELASKYFPHSSFNKETRTLDEGIISYMLAYRSYQILDESYNPTFQSGKSALRCAWLLEDYLTDMDPDSHQHKVFQELQDYYYQQSARNYDRALKNEENGKEPLSNVSYIGPDTDRDFGYVGIKYLFSLLNFRMCFFEPDIEMRIKKFNTARIFVSQLFGFGVATKEKPSPLLHLAKMVTHKISETIDDYQRRVANGEEIREDRIIMDVIPDDELGEDLRFDYTKSLAK